MAASWSCDLDHLYKISFPLPKDAPYEVWLRLAKRFQGPGEKMFHYYGNIHVSSPSAGADNPQGAKIFH